MFGNVVELLALHKRVFVAFKNESEQPRETQNWAQAFRVFVPEFQKLYQVYSANQKKVRPLRMKLAKEDNYKHWVEEQKKINSAFDLNSLLIKPVQRICKYPLLMRELLKTLETLGVANIEEAKSELEAAMEEMSDVLNESNEAMMTMRTPRKK